MTIRGGNIVRKIGGESIKRAKKSLILEATHDNLILYSAKKVEMIGEQGGVEYLNDYTPPPPLRVVKLDGPFDEKGQKVSCIKKGIYYKFKIVKYNRSPTSIERHQIRWATQYENQSIFWNYPQVNGKEEIIINVDRNIKSSYIIVYAYYNIGHVGLEQSSLKIGIEKFYYKGIKNWGKLQSGFATEYGKITEEQIKKHANRLGWVNINSVRNKSLKSIKESYENLLLGTRRVLSKEVADKVINNFYSGKGKKLSFDENSKISKDLKEYRPFREYFDKYLEVIKYLIKDKAIQTKNGENIIEIFSKHIKFRSLPNFNQPLHIIDYDYYGLMGGTQTIKVELEIEEDKPRKFLVKTKMYIGDWYGADWDDVNGVIKGSVHSLSAFFWLQHHYGYQPFETEIIYQSLDYLTL